MTSKVFHAVILLFLVTLFHQVGFAQEPEASPTGRIREISALSRVRILMNAGDFRGAAAYLESIKEEEQSNPAYDDLLAICYKKTGQNLKLLALIKDRLRNEGNRPELIRDFGEAHLLNGNLDSAQYYYYQATLFLKNQPAQLEQIANAFYRLGYFEHVIRFIDSARVIAQDPGLLAIRRADALAGRKMFGEAASEYLNQIERDTQENREAIDKLMALIEYPESVDTVMTILSSRISRHSSNRRLSNIYARALLEQQKMEEAFEFYRERDRVKGGSGSELLSFMQDCLIHKREEYVIRAGHYMLEKYPDTPLRFTAYLIMAEAFTNLKIYDKALASYDTVAQLSQRASDKVDAQLQIGSIFKDYLDNPGEARKYFEAVLNAVPRSKYGSDALFGLADVFARERRFDSAIYYYDSLLRQDLPEEFAEEANFRLAKVYLFQGHYEDAGKQFRRVINKFPMGLFVNDAIQLVLILDETLEQSRDHLDLFSAAEFFRHTGETDSLEYYLLKIGRIGIPSLAPVSYLNLARVYLKTGRLDDALEALDSLTADYPDSYFYPFGLKAKADILWDDEKTRETARALYKNILENYGTYPFAAEIRDILRREEAISRL